MLLDVIKQLQEDIEKIKINPKEMHKDDKRVTGLSLNGGFKVNRSGGAYVEFEGYVSGKEKKGGGFVIHNYGALANSLRRLIDESNKANENRYYLHLHDVRIRGMMLQNLQDEVEGEIGYIRGRMGKPREEKYDFDSNSS